MPDVFKCANCQAALKAVPGRQVVVCEYCGSTNVLRKGVWSTNLGVPAAPPAAPGPPVPLPPVVVAPRRSGRVGLAVGLVLLLGVFVSVFAVHRSGMFDEWYAQPCLVDANGDGVLDVAGVSGSPENRKLTMVDGVTGDRLWTGEAISGDDQLLCTGPASFAVDGAAFRLRLYDARHPDKSVEAPLADHVNRFGIGQGCVLLELKNEEQQTVWMQEPTSGACEVATWLKTFHSTGYGEPLAAAAAGDVTYSLTTRETGTRFLVVTARRGDQELWRTELRLVEATFSTGLAATPGVLVVYGADPADTHYGIIVGLDPQTGAERYAVRQGSHWSAQFQGLAYNGRFVIASWGFGLHAYDPATGERVWNIGGR